jgi:hypothetical protein
MSEVATVPKQKPFLEVVDDILHVHPHEGQRRALESKKQIIAMLCGKQAGKSVTCPLWMYNQIIDWDRRLNDDKEVLPTDGVFWSVSPSFPLQEEKLQPIFYDFFVSMLGIGKYYVQKKKFDITIDHNDGTSSKYEIRLKSGDKVESLASATTYAICIDEAGQNSFSQAAWEECRARIGSTGGKILLTTTIYNFGWLKHLIYDEWRKGNPSIDVIQFESIMNPFFSRAEWDNARRVLPAWKFDMSYRGIFTRPLGRIYQDFDETCIVAPFEVPISSYVFIGIDPGITHHSTVFLSEIYPNQPEYTNFPLSDGANPVYVLYDSNIVGSDTTTTTNKEHATALKSHKDFDKVKTVCGGAKSEIYFREDYRAMGVEIIEPPYKEVSAGIDTITAMLKTHQLYICSDQTRIIKEFEEYSYKLDIEGEITPIIENKEMYHGLDGVRYICLAIGKNTSSIVYGFNSVAGRSVLDAY